MNANNKDHAGAAPEVTWSITISGNDIRWLNFKINGGVDFDVLVAALEAVKFKKQLERATLEAMHQQQMMQQGKKPDGKRMLFGADGQPIG